MAQGRRTKTEAAPPGKKEVGELPDRFVLRTTFRLDNDTQTSLRLPRTMYDALLRAASEHRRGISEEIRQRLEASLGNGPAAPRDERFVDLLTALAHVAAGAARIYPAKRVEYEGEEVEDISAQIVFEAATYVLLDAFRPVGLWASLPAGPEGRMEASRRADRLVSAALGALGDRGIAAFDRLSEFDQKGIVREGFAPKRESEP
jgi:hypothetical protein